jgi:hypothetical protein
VRWNVKQLLLATFVVVLLLVAQEWVENKALFALALYLAQLALVSISAWNAEGKMKRALVAYSLFGWAYLPFPLLLPGSSNKDIVESYFAGAVIGIACGITAGMLSPANRE